MKNVTVLGSTFNSDLKTEGNRPLRRYSRGWQMTIQGISLQIRRCEDGLKSRGSKQEQRQVLINMEINFLEGGGRGWAIT